MNSFKSNNFLKILFLLILLLGGTQAVASELNLTDEEQTYIQNRSPIIASSIDGVAPLQYKNSKGQVVGIAVRVLEEISAKTGLVFEYSLHDSIETVYESNPDIIFGISPIYAKDNIILSTPYLKSKTILFMNSSLSSNNLDDKIFAAITGGPLPYGVDEKNTIYYDTREESLDAVEKGEAGYGYGNEYSIAYYRIQNGYKNIITVPNIKEIREYSIGLITEDEILLSIINKAIDAIDELQMNALILDSASLIETKITLSLLLNTYGEEIFGVIVIIILVLLVIMTSNVRARKELSLQNKRYILLANISNECIFEYDTKTKKMNLSDKCEDLLGIKENLPELKRLLEEAVLSNGSKENMEIINIKFSNGNTRVLKVIKSEIYDSAGKKLFISGKLVDISDELAEKRELINKAKIDGLTNLYNNITTKKVIDESIKNRNINTTDALILMDCDKFKNINDTLGHLEGDKALINVSKVLKNSFGENDIIGRVGGDEFCVYVKDIPSLDYIKLKCDNLIAEIREADKKHDFSVSIGIAFLKNEQSYEELFMKADEALYEAKKIGGAKAVVCTK